MSDFLIGSDPVYTRASLQVMSVLAILSLMFFLVRHKSAYFMAGWVSLRSWLFLCPFILSMLALPFPWVFVFLSMVGIFSAKKFFQMVGTYHRSWFVWTTYIFILWAGLLAYENKLEIFNLTPMIFLGTVSLVPIMRNSASHMIQYIALSLLSFIFWGWSLLHLGFFLHQPRGVFIILYLFLLIEISDNVALAAGRFWGGIKLFDKISKRVTLEGTLVGWGVALLSAWEMKDWLPDQSGRFWIFAGCVATLGGRLGRLILSGIRRDLGVKNTGIFIIGRGDILSRTDKLIFVGPLFFYLYMYLQQS